MRPAKLIAFLLCFEFGAAIGGFGQTPSTPPKPDSDVLIFVDGERLIGHLESATGSVVVFKSDMAGEVTVDWSKIQELRSPQQFAAIRKDSELRTSSDAAAVPQGAVAMTNQQLEVQGVKGLPQTIPVGDLGTVVDEASFQQALANPGFTEGWKGGATAGVSLIQATQNTQTFTSAVNLVRTRARSELA